MEEIQLKQGMVAQEQEQTTNFTSQNYPYKALNKFSGWRKAIFFGIFVTVVTLIINIGLIVGVSVRRGFTGGNAVLYNGSCTTSSRLELGVHILINVLGTALLGASNYCMQVLSAPTRNEIDKAHRRGTWLNFGVLGFTNLRRISGMRTLLWVTLGGLSLPLHLLYNSVVYASITSYEYNGYIVSPEFLQGAPFSPKFFSTTNNILDNTATGPSVQDALDAQAQYHTWENLTNTECITAYSQAFLLDRSDVIVVTKVSNATDSLYMGILDGNVFLGVGDTGNWMCGLNSLNTCNIADPSKQPNPQNWTVTAYQDIDGSEEIPVDYCLSRFMPDICTMSANLPLMIAVIVCNFAKLIAMGLVIWACKEEPIVTIGDAVKSFLDREDPTIMGRSLYGRQDFKGNWQNVPGIAKPYQLRRQFWISSISGGRFWISLACCIIAGIVVGVLLRDAIVALSLGVISLSTIGSLGFGRINSRAYWDNSPTTFYPNVIIANVPQLLFSLLYIAYNSLYTSMHLGSEWSSFSSQRKPLRVTNPRGAQHSTYWLQLPYTYGIPLMLANACMHWIISQSFFLEIVDFPRSTDEGAYEAVTCGYSILPIVATVALGGVMLITMLLNACRWRRTGMPVVGTCSAAIRAACHPDDGADSSLPLQWGVIEQDMSEGGVGRCAFSSEIVTSPVEGALYS